MTNNVDTYGAFDLSTAARAKGASRSRALLGGAIGHFIEWYDLTIYGLFVAIFAGQMFPADHAGASLIAGFSAFAIGSLGRPIGALVLCPLADRYGRRPLFSATILMSGIGSLVIGLCPTYEQIGLAAPLLIFAARLLQGLSAGGEMPIASTFLNEHAPLKHRALAALPQVLSMGLAVLAAMAVANLIMRLVPLDALADWGWRLPFLLGGAISLYGLSMRQGLSETPAFAQNRVRHETSNGAVFDAIAKRPKDLAIVFVMRLMDVQSYLWLMALPVYASLVGELDHSHALTGSVAALAVYCACIPLFAWISDRLGRRPLLIASCAGLVLLTYPLLSLLSGSLDFDTYVTLAMIGAVLVALNNAVMGTALAELFPTHIRATGIGLPQALSIAIFGNTTLSMMLWLHDLGRVSFIAAYAVGLTAASLAVCVFVLPETRGRPLD